MKVKLTLIAALLVTTFMCRAQTPMLWGVTSSGGQYGQGTVFSFDMGSGVYTLQHSFGNDTDGSRPVASLMQANNGVLYGMTNGGGSNGLGAIFSVNSSTGTETVVHSFDSWGYGPWGSLIQVGDSLLYGMTTFGGPVNGTIFKFNFYTGDFLYVHDFGYGADSLGGIEPYGSLLQVNNLLYGTTNTGPVSDGTIFNFNYTLTTGADTTKYFFGIDTSDGLSPYSTLMMASNGLLYGTTLLGGDDGAYNLSLQGSSDIALSGAGTIFSFNPATGKQTVVYNFGSDTAGGIFPYGALLQAGDSLLYGMTMGSGPTDTIYSSNNSNINIYSSSGGTIYGFNIYTDTTEILYHFGGHADGRSPAGALAQGNNGLLYGMTLAGGSSDSGTIFIYNTSTHTETVLHSFTGADGASPYGSLLQVNFATGITQPVAGKQTLQIYPNPSAGQFVVELPGNQSYKAEVYNMPGQQVQQLVLSSTQNTIDLSSQSAGMYFVYVHTSTGVAVGKLMVER